MTEIVADLHTHTTRSDGTMEPENVTDVANRNDLKAIALTDHDRVHPDIDDPLVVRDGVDVISGIELRVQPEEIDERLDILGYGVIPTSRFQSVLDRVQKNRIHRAERMIDLIEDETGVRIDVELIDSVGRPHIARAIDDNEHLDYTYSEAFEELIGDDCPCYTSRDIPSFEYGVSLLQESASFVSLAHPYRYEDVRGALKLARGFDGIECVYPYASSTVEYKRDGMDELAVEWFEQVMTGGSDAHNPDDVGSAGLMMSHYQKFLKESNLDYYSINA